MRGALCMLGLTFAVTLAACVNDPSGRARADMEESRNAYMQCLDRNPETPAVCSGLKAAFDQNMKEYMETSNPPLKP